MVWKALTTDMLKMSISSLLTLHPTHFKRSACLSGRDRMPPRDIYAMYLHSVKLLQKVLQVSQEVCNRDDIMLNPPPTKTHKQTHIHTPTIEICIAFFRELKVSKSDHQCLLQDRIYTHQQWGSESFSANFLLCQ